MPTILVIDDEELTREALKINLKDTGYSVYLAEDGKSALQIVDEVTPDVIVCDLKLPDHDGLYLLEKFKEIDSNIQVIILTAYDDMNSAILAMQKGALDYIQKPPNFKQLKIKIARALENKSISEHLSSIIQGDTDDFQSARKLIGRTPGMMKIYKYIGQLSLNKVTILVEGESGTGKELISKVIHYSSTKDFPFIPVNCTALSEHLLESELFGHVKGAFTGAVRDKKGKFELAGEGTIFLDEISEMSTTTQIKLLRVLQEREFEKVGGEISIPMKARIIAASNRNLSRLVDEGKFREDLYYRLKVFSIYVPPLRNRKDDIPLLVSHFLKKINMELHKDVRKIPYKVMEILKNHNWVGNVRELENVLLQAVVLSKNDFLEVDDIILCRENQQEYYDMINNGNNGFISLQQLEKEYIKLILKKVNGNKQKACEILNISKPTLYSKIHKYHFEEILTNN